MKRGFTLIELLVVIALIGILSTIVSVNYPSYVKKANDAKRMSDLKQYQISLETYANKNSSLYPSYTSTTRLSTGVLCTSLLGTGSTCPEDKKYSTDTTYVYDYISNGDGTGTANALNYVIWGKLENVSSATYLYYCSTGKSGTTTTLTSLTGSSGTCPP
jgi:prepilin-type N-terminal cleavage/methylation domain-containing protein